jgi:predicted nucleic acid-binding protein
VNIEYRLRGVKRLFLDTAPLIYYVEENRRYLPLVDVIFDRIFEEQLIGITSPISLAECLARPYRLGQTQLQQNYFNLITATNLVFTLIDQNMARQAAEFRSRYNLELPDAFQIAVAVATNCEAFLTNDAMLRRITEIQVLVLDDFD